MDSMDAKEALYQLGFKSQFIAAGMEGFVFGIGNSLLAKVWIKKSYEEVAQLRSFYSQLREKQAFRDIYPLYKAAYALVTSNAYSEDGDDGHFRWCVDILNDEETNMALS